MLNIETAETAIDHIEIGPSTGQTAADEYAEQGGSNPEMAAFLGAFEI